LLRKVQNKMILFVGSELELTILGRQGIIHIDFGFAVIHMFLVEKTVTFKVSKVIKMIEKGVFVLLKRLIISVGWLGLCATVLSVLWVLEVNWSYLLMFFLVLFSISLISGVISIIKREEVAL